MRRREFIKLAAASAAITKSTRAPGGPSNPYRPWLTPEEAPLPDWAQTGNFVFMGLDGGPLEAEKGLRSGWQGFTSDDPQGIVRAVREFYRPENVEIPIAAGANWVFLTWTNGWSKERERRDQWPLAARFLQECRRRGIHVSAYISGANMFWEDYLERVPESRKWIETGSPSYIRHYGNSLYRVMANLKLPAWREEIKTAISAALEAGVEGFWMDNLFWWHGESLFLDFMREMRAHAARRRSNLVWHANVNRGVYNWGRAGNVVGTEDGRAPQFHPDRDPAITGNLGLLSFLAGLKEEWRSAELEHYGNNLSAALRQLMIAECWMWQVGCTWFPVDRLLQAQLHRREPAAWEIFQAMGVYNRHQLKYREFFQTAKPVANVGLVGHPGSSGEDLESQIHTQRGQTELIELLDRLAGWGVQYEVLFEDRLQPEPLKRFSLVVMPDPEHLPQGAAESLSLYVRSGGNLIAPESARHVFKNGQVILLPDTAFQAKGTPQLLRNTIRRYQAPLKVEVTAPSSVAYRALRQRGRTVVHLVNYKMEPVAPFTALYRGTAARAECLTPEEGRSRLLKLNSEREGILVSVPEFPIHSLLIFYD